MREIVSPLNGFLSPFGRISGSGAAPYTPTDANAAAYIAAVETADGQTLEDGVREAIDDFIIGCKADGIWSAIKASCILAGARTLAGALTPLVGTAPTNYNFVSGDYNRETGLKTDGTTKYIDTNRNNNADPQDSKHIAVYATDVTSAINQAYINTSFGTGFSAVNTLNVSTASITIHTNTGPIATQNVVGLIAGNRSASNVQEARGGGATTSNTTASQTQRNENLRVFTTGTPRISFYSIGESLDLADLDTRVSALMTDLGNAIP